MGVDLVSRDTQRIETVAHERQIVQPLHGFPERPDSLGEARAEEIVRHAPIDAGKKWERVDERSAAGSTVVPADDREGLVESPANVPGDDD